jgi:lipopolysaccharide exporter
VQNAAYMFSASAWAILIQFLLAPVISRIYDPEVYGLFSIFNSWVVVIGAFACMSYNQAFVLPEKPGVFRALLHLAMKSLTVVTILTTALFALAWPYINELFNASALGAWTVLVGPIVLLVALDRVLVDWSIRQKSFKKQSLISIPVTAGTKGFNIGYGSLVSNTVEGLIFTHALNHLSRIILYFRFVVPDVRSTLKSKVDPKDLAQAKTDYANYPRYMTWSNALNTGSNYLPIVILPIFLNSTEPAGLFAYALVVLDLPARLLGSGVNPVFLQKAVELNRDDPGRLPRMTWKIFLILIALVALPLMALGIFGEVIYKIAFGENWTEAGLLAAILGCYYFFRLISSPISSIFNVKRKERDLFWFQLSLFSARLISLLVACLITDSLVEIIAIFAAANAFVYWILTGWIFSMLKRYVWQSLLVSAGTFAVLTYLVVWLRQIIF